MGAKRRPRQPAYTAEGRETQLVSLAFDLAEKRLTEGTATSQEVTHFLKLGSSREKLEQQRLQQENLLLSAKREQIVNSQRYEQTVQEALRAMKVYTGQETAESEGL